MKRPDNRNPSLGGYAGHMTALEVARCALVNRALETRWEALGHSGFSSLGGGQGTAPSLETVSGLGAAGVGKTRLVGAFREWLILDSPGVEIWDGRAFEMGGRLPYQPVIESLRQRLERENAPEDLLDDVWLAELSELMPELRARYPDLPPPMTGDASFVRARLFSAVATLGSALSSSIWRKSCGCAAGCVWRWERSRKRKKSSWRQTP